MGAQHLARLFFDDDDGSSLGTRRAKAEFTRDLVAANGKAGAVMRVAATGVGGDRTKNVRGIYEERQVNEVSGLAIGAADTADLIITNGDDYR